jgi:hypothetical protein
MERQPPRHLLTTHLHAIAQRTGLKQSCPSIVRLIPAT